MNYNFRAKVVDSHKPQRRKFFTYIVIGLILIGYIAVALSLPVKKINGQISDIPSPVVNTAKISWPQNVQAAFGAQNYGVLGISGEQKAVPIASIAKTMLGLAVLEQKPINKGEQGPQISITAQDVDFYKTDLAQNGSVVPVNLGEKLSEYQMLQALLIPSGDNIASTLATWTFGSLTNYLNYANEQTQNWGMKNTHFADASGLSPETVSSAEDLVILGEKIMGEPVLKEIVAQSQITLPIAGKVNNYNTLLGQENIVGIKTGNTDEAGGCFLGASTSVIDGKEVTVLSAILGAKDRNQALSMTRTFMQANVSNLKLTTVVKSGQSVASYNVPWGKKVDVVAKDDLVILSYNGGKIETKVSLDSVSGAMNKGDKVGEISAKINNEEVKVPAILNNKISKPSILWRLFHP